ncbi:ion channel [Pontibacter sp. G13]|uniref:ion channel n=1 Tax=Pontibacter sp. G13 TaxID=3074898 RepID=UPI00288C4BD8|nr:ion channel [Pontibacter sp. G13]WNJ17793.1 ion channel [Pontibacter sp. G13]
MLKESIMAETVASSEAPKQVDEAFRDLGFGTKIDLSATRLINKDGSFNVIRRGGGIGAVNLYQYLITISWWGFAGWVFVSYLILNAIFALIYMTLGLEYLSSPPLQRGFVEEFLHAFYFSAQTFTTVGYGAISPEGHPASMVSSIESMMGLMGIAIATGVLYGRFSRPTAKIRFSEKMIVAPYQDINGLMFRIVNRRQNQLVELDVLLVYARYEMVNGRPVQRFSSLELERNHVALFPLTWTIVHPITEDSPIYGMDSEAMKAKHAEFLIVIKAYDDTFAQEVHARHSYQFDELVCGVKFVPAFEPDGIGNYIVDVNRVGEYKDAPLNPAPKTPKKATD